VDEKWWGVGVGGSKVEAVLGIGACRGRGGGAPSGAED
jgi:hypothetical protein